MLMIWKKNVHAVVLFGSLVAFGVIIYLTQSNLLVRQANKEIPQLSELISLLLDDNTEVREQAFKNIQSLGSDASVPVLIKSLKNPDWQTRVIAAHTLGRLGSVANLAIADLNTAIKDENVDVRVAVAQALGNIGSEKVVPALIQALEDKNENVRVSAATALAKIGITAKPASSALTKALWDNNWFVRKQASKALSILGLDSIDIPLMVDPLNQIQKTRDGGIISLITAIDPSVLNHPESISLFFIQALKNQDPKIRQSAARALGQIRFTRFAVFGNQEYTNALLLGLKDQDAKVRVSVVEALGSYSRESKKDSFDQVEITKIWYALLTVINTDKDAEVRANAFDALQDALPYPTPVPETTLTKEIISTSIKALKDEDTQIRQNAIELLRRIKFVDFSPSFKVEVESLIYPNLVNLLYDKDESIRQKAFKSISDYYGEIDNLATSEVINIVRNKDLDKEIRRSITASMRVKKLAKSESGLNSLFIAKKDEDVGIQQNIFLALRTHIPLVMEW